MSVSGKTGRNISQYERLGKRMTLDDVLKFPCLAVPQQTIIKEDAEYFGIRSELDQETGLKIVATYFPYYNQKKELTGFKRRDWTKAKDERGHFTIVGSISTSSMLFGENKCIRHAKRPVYFVEGEGDCVATRRALLDGLKGTKWEGKITHFNVVSLSLGAGNAEEVTAHNEDFLRSGSCLVLRMDADHATELEALKGVVKGEEAMDTISGFLLWDQIYTIDMPEGMKDPRDMVEAGRSSELGEMLSFNRKLFSPEKISDLTNITLEQLRRSKRSGIPMTQFPVFSSMSKSVIKGELWVATGPSGAGKSTIVRWIEHDITNYLINGLREEDWTNEKDMYYDKDGKLRLVGYTPNEKLGAIHLEEDIEETINSLIAMDVGVDPKDFVEDPKSYLSEEEHEKALARYRDSKTINILDHFGSLAIKQLMNKFKQLYASGVRWFILDHLSMVFSGLQVDNERKLIDVVMTELAAFTKQHNVFILVVSHINRNQNTSIPKDKEGNTLPYWVTVRKEQLRGSAAIEQLGMTIFSVEPEELPDRSRGRVRLVSLKNRRGKKLGIADTLSMNKNGTFRNARDWEYINGQYVDKGIPVKMPSDEYNAKSEPIEDKFSVDIDKPQRDTTGGGVPEQGEYIF